MTRSKIEKIAAKEAYVRRNSRYISGLTWEKELRRSSPADEESQLVSEIINEKDDAKRLKRILIECEPLKINNAAYAVVQSRNGGFRVAIFFNKIRQLPREILDRAANFLNLVHAPLITKGEKIFKCSWIINGKELVCKGPSISYRNFLGFIDNSNVISGANVEDSLRNEFSQTAQKAGFDTELISQFKNYLISHDHKGYCYHFIADLNFIGKLAALGENYNKTLAPVSTKIPSTLSLFSVGKSPCVEYAAKLPQNEDKILSSSSSTP